MSWPHDTPAPGRVSLGRVVAARMGHARRRQKSERFFDDYPDFQPAEACTEVGAEPVRGKQAAKVWVVLLTPGTVAIGVIAFFFLVRHGYL